MTPAAKEGLPAVVGELVACPFCGGTNTQVRTSSHWTGMRSEIISATVMHWCEHQPGELQSVLQVKGKTEADAITAWNRRATLSALTAEAGKGDERARELLAAEMREHYPSTAERLLDFGLSIESFPLSTEAAIRAIRLALSTATPAGEWVLVPREPTAEMLMAAGDAVHNATYWATAYRAMLAASPRGASAGEAE